MHAAFHGASTVLLTFVTPDIPRVGALAAAITLTPALLGFAGLLTATASLIAAPNRPTQDPPSADSAT